MASPFFSIKISNGISLKFVKWDRDDEDRINFVGIGIENKNRFYRKKLHHSKIRG